MNIFRLQDCDESTEPLIRRNGGQVNVLVDNGNIAESDLDALFGPEHVFDTFIVVPPDTSWAHILAGLGCFPSISQARKNGWNKPIEPGFTHEFKVGKAARKFFCAWNPTEPGEGSSFTPEGR